MSNLAIIPARSGSKRIPKKNIKLFAGKPIIAFSIEAALNSGLFDEVMVSTDSPEIAKIAIGFGAKVPFLRSEENSNDYASTMDVINEVCDSYEKEFQQKFDYICCIYATAPLIKMEHLIVGINKMKNEKLTCVFPAVLFSYPIWRGFQINAKKLELLSDKFVNSRTQDLEKTYHDAGQWYWFDYTKIKNWKWPENSGIIELNDLEVQDIDNFTDWEIAEMKYMYTSKKQNEKRLY
jgi:pseudaminic acid cytidylyltransferase